jgi:hypothetical protein
MMTIVFPELTKYLFANQFQVWDHQNMDDLFFFDDQLSDAGSYGEFFSGDQERLFH